MTFWSEERDVKEEGISGQISHFQGGLQSATPVLAMSKTLSSLQEWLFHSMESTLVKRDPCPDIYILYILSSPKLSDLLMAGQIQ